MAPDGTVALSDTSHSCFESVVSHVHQMCHFPPVKYSVKMPTPCPGSAFITWSVCFTGHLKSPLLNCYLLVIITSALTLGKLTTAMVQAGESSGKLHESLTKLADITESRVRLKRKVMSAMTYPVVMVGLVVMIFFAMLMFVVPTFASIYDQIDGKLPKLTEFLMSMSFFLRHNILMVGIAGVGGAIGFSRLKKLPQFKLVKDRVIIRLPLFGDLFRSAAMARVATTLASSLGAGVPLLDSLQLSADVANNKLYSDALMQAREDVRNGKSFGNSLRSKPIITEMFTALVDIGEETGQLDALLNRYAEIVEEEVEAKVEAITSLIEPIMIVIFGGLVGVMVIALYLPLINIFKFLQ